MEDHLNFLHDAALFTLLRGAPALSSHYLRRLRKEAQSADIKLDKDLNHRICPTCSCMMIPGWTTSPLYSSRKGPAKEATQRRYWRRDCLVCRSAQRIHSQREDKPEEIPKVARSDRLPSLLRQKQLAAKSKAQEVADKAAREEAARRAKAEAEKPVLSKWSLLHAEQKKPKKKKSKPAEASEEKKETDLMAFLGSSF